MNGLNDRNATPLLMKTLELAGIDRKSPKILAHGCTKETIRNVHKETNSLLQESMKNDSLGECIHITGGMRALTDPFHRYICEEISNKVRNVFRVVYSLPDELMDDIVKALEWSLKGWASGRKGRVWHEDLRTIYSIANRSVRLYAFDTSDEIQYSVFGNRFILLQERHNLRTIDKHTWLLESEQINSDLTARAADLIRRSKDVDEGIYRRFTRNISGVSSKRLLSLLQGKSAVPIEVLIADEIANDFTESINDIIDAVEVMGFVSIAEDGIAKITEAGSQFLGDVKHGKG